MIRDAGPASVSLPALRVPEWSRNLAPRDAMITPHQRHSWVWAVIPPASRRVRVVGNAQLAATLRHAGLEVVLEPVGAVRRRRDDGEPTGVDATLMPLGGGTSARQVVGLAADSAPIVAVTIGGGDVPIRDRVPRAQRGFELLLTPLTAAWARLVRAPVALLLRGTRRRVFLLAMSDRSRSTYGLGSGLLRRRLVPTGWIVVASRQERPGSVVEAAAARASSALGRELHERGMSVVESGKVMLELADGAERRYILRVTAGSSTPFLENALEAVGALTSSNVPDAVRDRLVEPLTVDRLGPALYSLEPKVAGEHPRRMSARLWQDCLDFLVALHRLPGGGGDTAAFVQTEVGGDLELVARHVDARGRKVLELLQPELADCLGGVPLGWEHGDFWLQNLLAREGRLATVLDWDTAARASLPMLDLMDLIALSSRRSSTLTPGPRSVGVLWPLVRAGGDRRMHEYAEATGTPRDARTLRALARAYWLRRVARDLRDYPDRQVRRRWIAENIHAPLAELERWK